MSRLVTFYQTAWCHIPEDCSLSYISLPNHVLSKTVFVNVAAHILGILGCKLVCPFPSILHSDSMFDTQQIHDSTSKT